jgi:hypothetical protein
MNEQAFDDLYKEFVNTGYRGSKADFKVLLQTNPNAFSDGYGAFTSTGYKGSDEDFAKLMGVVNPLKKKTNLKEVWVCLRKMVLRHHQNLMQKLSLLTTTQTK